MVTTMFEEIKKLKTDQQYVVFDVETTGLDANNNSIIEIAAVKIKNGVVIDEFSHLINPGFDLPEIITNITGITDSMLKSCIDEKTAVNMFLNWISDLPIIAHNSDFDMSFINNACYKYSLTKPKNIVIDTLYISRKLRPYEKSHKLNNVMKMYDIEFDINNCHRALYDAKKTSEVFIKMLDIICRGE